LDPRKLLADPYMLFIQTLRAIGQVGRSAFRFWIISGKRGNRERQCKRQHRVANQTASWLKVHFNRLQSTWADIPGGSRIAVDGGLRVIWIPNKPNYVCALSI
jgi:hypothetical protein